MVPEFLELGIFGSLINRRCHFLEMQIGLESYGFARKKVPLHEIPPPPVCPLFMLWVLRKRPRYNLGLGSDDTASVTVGDLRHGPRGVIRKDGK